MAILKPNNPLGEREDVGDNHLFTTKIGKELGRRSIETIIKKVCREYISGDSDFYLKLTDALGDAPVMQRARYRLAFDNAVIRFTIHFAERFCTDAGGIDWDKITQFNSGRRVSVKQSRT